MSDRDYDVVASQGHKTMTDIVERLRNSPPVEDWSSLMDEAADEIERLDAVVLKQTGEIDRLRAENKRLQDALIEAAEMVT